MARGGFPGGFGGGNMNNLMSTKASKGNGRNAKKLRKQRI